MIYCCTRTAAWLGTHCQQYERACKKLSTKKLPMTNGKESPGSLRTSDGRSATALGRRHSDPGAHRHLQRHCSAVGRKLRQRRCGSQKLRVQWRGPHCAQAAEELHKLQQRSPLPACVHVTGGSPSGSRKSRQQGARPACSEALRRVGRLDDFSKRCASAMQPHLCSEGLERSAHRHADSVADCRPASPVASHRAQCGA